MICFAYIVLTKNSWKINSGEFKIDQEYFAK